jgi:hypothetical protein
VIAARGPPGFCEPHRRSIIHLRDVLGEATDEPLARTGETMTTAARAAHTNDQIDQARTELEHAG